MNKVRANVLNNKGQIVIILLLVMLLALVVALAVAQRSLTYLSGANKSEQSSRAFSAAESQIEQILHGNPSQPSSATFNNRASALLGPGTSPLPAPGSTAAIEYPPISKDTPAQVWLVDPQSNTFIGAPVANTNYPGSSQLLVYYGSANSSDPNNYGNLVQNLQGGKTPTPPAVEVDLITFDNTNNIYKTYKYFFDDKNLSRISNNHFSQSTCSSTGITPAITTIDSPPAKTFACVTGLIPPSNASPNPPAAETPVMARVRLLYTDISQPVAFQPQGGHFFPSQVQILTSLGSSGQVKRQVKVFKAPYVVPPFFDYAIFSATDVKKCQGAGC